VLQETLQKVNDLWKKEGLSLAKPFLPAQLTGTFGKLGVRLSKDVIEVYSTLGGMTDGEMDSECLSFWAIERILKENAPKSEFIYFADFLIDSHHYAFKIEDRVNSSIHVHYSEKDRPKVADSFDEFFRLYLTDKSKLFI
jgi:hypothetical protein